MGATVIINRWTGASPGAQTDITGINTVAQTADAHTATCPGSNRIEIPTTGSNYSYWVVTRLEITAISGTTLSNIKWYSDGTNNFGTGVTCVGNRATAYTQATGTPNVTGTVLNTTNYPSLGGAPQDVFGWTSAAPLTLTGTCNAVGDCSDFFVYQLAVDNTANPGCTPQETFTFQYDES